MKQTRKTALAFLLTLCVTLGLLPALTVTANAEGYSVTMDSMTNGSVTADKTPASEGDTVTLTITPEAGYELDALTVTRSDNGVAVLAVSVDAPSVDFPMPASNVNVSATFTKKAYSVNLGAVSNGALTPSASTAQAGDSVTLTVTPEAGYELDALTVTRSDNGESVTVTETSGAGSFTMPASNVTATATFKKISYPVEVQTVTGGAVSIITGYNADGSPITTNETTAQIDDTVTLEVIAADGMQLNPPLAIFARTPPEPSQTLSSTWNATQSNGCYSFTITVSNIDLTVNKITVAPRFTDGSSHNITVGDGIEHGTVTKLREKAPLYDTVRLAVRPNDGYVLDNLTVTPEGGGSVTPVQTSASSTTEYWAFTMPDKDVTVSATFVVGTKLDINMDIVGTGTVTVAAYGTETSATTTTSALTTAALNTVVTLKTAPGDGYELTSLTVTGETNGDEIELTDIEGGKQFSMGDENVTVYAVFKKTQTITPHGGGSDSATVVYGDTLEPVATAEGNATLHYSVTSGDDVIAVDDNGTLTALKVGSGVVHVEADETTQGDPNDRYAGAKKDVTVTVTQRPLTVTANAQTKTAGESDDPALTYTVTGFAGTDTAETVLTGALARVAGEAAGEYAITQGTLAPNDNYVIAYYTGAALTITAPPGPSYTIAAADTVTTEKKYHHNEEITIAVTVSGADFEGGEFTLNYDSDTLEVKTLPANNKFTDIEQTAGTVKFEALNRAKITDGQALATITFTVKTKVTTETTCNFTFAGTPKICYDTGENSVEAATVTPGSVIVEPIPYTVTLTPNPSDLTLTGNNGVEGADNANAIDGQPYTVTIGGYNTTDYEYAVTLAVEGTEGTTTLTPSDRGVITVEAANITGNLTITVTRTTKHVTATLEGGLLSGSTDAIKGVDYTATISDYDANNYTYAVTLTMNNASADDKATMSGGTITIDGDDITGDFTLTVTKTLANFTVTTTADYVTGWTLVTVAKTAANNGSPVYKYAGNDMYYVEAYSAYAYLVNVEGGVTVADATANVTLGDTEAVTIAAGYDVNNTGKVDYSDTLLTYRCYEKVHQTPATAMETYLRADVNNSKKVDTEDVSAIDANRTPES